MRIRFIQVVGRDGRDTCVHSDMRVGDVLLLYEADRAKSQIESRACIMYASIPSIWPHIRILCVCLLSCFICVYMSAVADEGRTDVTTSNQHTDTATSAQKIFEYTLLVLHGVYGIQIAN